MSANIFSQYGLSAVGWVVSAYFETWPVLLRLKYREFAWLRTQVEFVANEVPELEFSNSSFSETVELDKEAADKLLALHESVRLAARLHWLKADCLPKSIVLANQVKRRGYQARAVIGVRKTDGGLASHAWVEVLIEKKMEQDDDQQFNRQWIMLGEPESVSQKFQRV